MADCDLSEFSEVAAAELIRFDALINGANAPDKFWYEVLTERERQKLGGSPRKAWHGEPFRTAGLWARLHGVSLPRAVIEVSTRLGFTSDAKARWLLREFKEEGQDSEEEMEKAIANGDLVLLTQPFSLYFDGEKIDIAWDEKRVLLNFVEELCRHAKRNEPIDNLTFPQRCRRRGRRDRNYAVKTKHRLTNEHGFPIALEDLIIARNGQITLDLPASRIRIFQVGVKGTIEEYDP